MTTDQLELVTELAEEIGYAVIPAGDKFAMQPQREKWPFKSVPQPTFTLDQVENNLRILKRARIR